VTRNRISFAAQTKDGRVAVEEQFTPQPAPKFDPWTPPGADLAAPDPGGGPATASGPVYDSGQVALGTFFGTCLAGACSWR
jgi:hypothetical protein